MTFDEYQDSIDSFAIYPDKGLGSNLAIQYCTLGLVGEAGEVAENVKKLLRDDEGVMYPERKEALRKELGDVLWYLTRLIHELNLSLDGTAMQNIEKLLDRKNRGVLGGSGDNR